MKFEATVTVSIDGVPFFNGVIDPRCLSVQKGNDLAGIPGLIEPVPHSRVTITHVDGCECGDRSRELVMNIPSKDFTVDIAREG